MTDSEKLDLILSRLDSIEQRTTNIEQRTTNIEHRITNIEQRTANIEQRTTNIEQRTTNIELTLESETNRNIQLLAENHLTLIDKLNQAIKVADKTLLYEVQMTSLKSRLELLEKEVAEMKKATA